MAGAGLCFAAMPTSGYSQPESSSQVKPGGTTVPKVPSPWNEGVTDKEKAAAKKAFAEGNGFFERSQYAEALKLYRQAIDKWDHPAIHFNIAVCLINLDQPVNAFMHLKRAMQAGASGLGEHFYAQAVTYNKLLAGRLGRLEITCDQEAANISLDGKEILSCPGSAQQYLLPGEHQLVGKKAGYLTLTKTLRVRAGHTHKEGVELMKLELAKRTERRWAVWKPWAVVGSGAGLALLGLGVRSLAQSDTEQFDRDVARECPQGCSEESLPESIRDVRSRAKTENAVAVGLFAGAAAAISTGAVLVFLNIPREVAESAPIAPMVVPGGAGATVTLTF